MLWLLSSGCDAPVAPVAERAADLEVAVPAHAAAVALVNELGQVFCSGSLVARGLVLTAAHCVLQDGLVTLPFAVYVGRDATLGGRYARVQGARTHPDYDPFLGGPDLALLKVLDLDEPIATVPLATRVPAPGDTLTYVAYGESDAGPLGHRHAGEARVTEAGESHLRYAPGTCYGDSGGMVLAQEEGEPRLVAVVSSATLLCTSATATAVPPQLPWIERASLELDPPSCRSGDGRCGDGCALGDGDCACQEDDGCRLCDGHDLDCSDACIADGQCTEDCVVPDPDCHSGAAGADCEEGIECASALCVDGACVQRCGSDATSGCPPWLACAGVSEGVSACLLPAAPASPSGCAVASSYAYRPPPGWIVWSLAASWFAVRRRRRSDAVTRAA